MPHFGELHGSPQSYAIQGFSNAFAKVTNSAIVTAAAYSQQSMRPRIALINAIVPAIRQMIDESEIKLRPNT